MKYYNTSGCRIVLLKESVAPKGVTLFDYEPEDLKKDIDLSNAVSCKAFRPYEEGDKPTVIVKKQDIRYIRDDVRADQKIVKHPSNKAVEYIIADSDSSDAIHTSDPDMVIAHDNDNPSADMIAEPLEANSLMKSGADMMEAQLNQDHENSTFDDSPSLAEHEDDIPDAMDVDDAMSRDASMFVRSNGKAGATVVGAKEIIDGDMSKALRDMNHAVSETSDEHEINTSAPARTAEFLKQSYAAKKKTIAKETDKAFLAEVSKATSSSNLKDIVKQRLTELG